MAPGPVATHRDQRVETRLDRLVDQPVFIAGMLRDPMLEAWNVLLEQFQVRGLTPSAAPPAGCGIEDDVDPPVGIAQMSSISSNV